MVELFREIREDLSGIVEVWIEKHIPRVITVNQVRDLLRSGRYDIIHYAGHACFNPDDPEGSAWLLSDGRVLASAAIAVRWRARSGAGFEPAIADGAPMPVSRAQRIKRGNRDDIRSVAFRWWSIIPAFAPACP